MYISRKTFLLLLFEKKKFFCACCGCKQFDGKLKVAPSKRSLLAQAFPYSPPASIGSDFRLLICLEMPYRTQYTQPLSDYLSTVRNYPSALCNDSHLVIYVEDIITVETVFPWKTKEVVDARYKSAQELAFLDKPTFLTRQNTLYGGWGRRFT